MEQYLWKNMWCKLHNTPKNERSVSSQFWLSSSDTSESVTGHSLHLNCIKSSHPRSFNEIRRFKKAADCQMQNKIFLPWQSSYQNTVTTGTKNWQSGSINDQGLQVWSKFSDLLNVPFWLKMQEVGPPLHKVTSLFDIQFLFLSFSVVF